MHVKARMCQSYPEELEFGEKHEAQQKFHSLRTILHSVFHHSAQAVNQHDFQKGEWGWGFTNMGYP